MTSGLIVCQPKLKKMKRRLTILWLPQAERPKAFLLCVSWPTWGFGFNVLKHWPTLFYFKSSIRKYPAKENKDSLIFARYRDMRPNSSSQDWLSGRWIPLVVTLGRSSTHASVRVSWLNPRLCLTWKWSNFKAVSVYVKRLSNLNRMDSLSGRLAAITTCSVSCQGSVWNLTRHEPKWKLGINSRPVPKLNNALYLCFVTLCNLA